MLQSGGIICFEIVQDYILTITIVLLSALTFSQVVWSSCQGGKRPPLIGLSPQAWFGKLRARIRYIADGYAMIFEGFTQVRRLWLPRLCVLLVSD